MSRLIWHPDAIDDVARLYDFLAVHSPVVAKRAASVIAEAADQVAENPMIGAPRAEFREWPARFGRSSYRARTGLSDESMASRSRIARSFGRRVRRSNPSLVAMAR